MKDLDGIAMLVAYPYAKGRLWEAVCAAASQGASIVIDSGAFTAWRTGKQVDREAYGAFLAALPFSPLFAVTLDVIGDPEATAKNTAALRASGANVVSVVTRGTPIEHIAASSVDGELLALGGLVGTPRAPAYVKHVMEAAPPRQWHWLGFTDLRLIAKYRPFSCDITTWHASMRRGSMLFLYKGNGKRVVLQPHCFAKEPSAEITRLLASYGAKPRELSTLAAWRGENSLAYTLNAQSFLRYARDIRTVAGTRLVFAGVSPGLIETLRTAAKRERSLGYTL